MSNDNREALAAVIRSVWADGRDTEDEIADAILAAGWQRPRAGQPTDDRDAGIERLLEAVEDPLAYFEARCERAEVRLAAVRALVEATHSPVEPDSPHDLASWTHCSCDRYEARTMEDGYPSLAPAEWPCRELIAFRAALDGDAATPEHQHEWVDATNPVVRGTDMCVGCGKVRATPDTEE